MRGDFEEDEIDDDFYEEDCDEEFPFDCHMDRNGQCGKTGSEEWDFECPIMADQRRREREESMAERIRRELGENIRQEP